MVYVGGHTGAGGTLLYDVVNAPSNTTTVVDLGGVPKMLFLAPRSAEGYHASSAGFANPEIGDTAKLRVQTLDNTSVCDVTVTITSNGFTLLSDPFNSSTTSPAPVFYMAIM